MSAVDVFAFLAQQRAPRRGERVVRIDDGEAGLAARTIARRLSSVAGLFEYLLARGDAGVASNPVARGLARGRAGRLGRGGVRLVRTPRTLPRVLSPTEVEALLGALRTRRDRAMVLAMLLGGLRRCEVLGLRLRDVRVGERRLYITCGKVEALYDAPRELPAPAEGAGMRKLRAELHRRMFGNGYCARPVGLDCHFESNCESCRYF